MGQEENLLAQFREFDRRGQVYFLRLRYNEAASHFFRAGIALCDVAIFRRAGAMMRTHEQRFEYLAEHFPEIYPAVSDMFSIYSKGAATRLERPDVEAVMGGVSKVARFFKLDVPEAPPAKAAGKL